MSPLAQQQQALLADLLAVPTGADNRRIAALVDAPWQRGLQVYQANGHAMAEAGLGSAYPVVAQLLGAESFAQLARAFWHASPPQRGDIAQWGAALPDFVAASAQLADEPYLADVARVEWALHVAALAADRDPEPASLALLTQADPAQLDMRLAPGTFSLASAWPVASIVNAHVEATPSFDTVGQRLRAGQRETALVWRDGLRARVREALPGEAALVSQLLAGHSLGHALDAAAGLDFAVWLPLAVKSRLLLSVQARD